MKIIEIIFNAIHDNHENLINAQNREIAVRYRAIKKLEQQEEVPDLFGPWSADDEPIVI